MRSLTALVLSLCDLFEAEGRLLQENILRTIFRSLLILTGTGFAVAALAFFTAGIYDLLLTIMPKALALGCLGLFSGLLSLILFWSSGQWGKRKKSSPRKDVQE